MLGHCRRFYFISSNSTSQLQWKPFDLNRRQNILISIGQLSKLKLSAMVLLTTMTGYLAAPLSSSASPSHLALTMAGTALCSFSANSFNQWAEAPLDAQMSRTRGRPLPRLALTPFAAFNWAAGAGLSGVLLLGSTVNWTAAGWAALTIVLYAGVYTPLKRISLYNTWIGSVVGAIPPLIGWSALHPQLTTASLILPGVLYAWQFPHFMALSWNLRKEYARAGYQMASLMNPELNKRVALRYALLLVPITLAATPLGVGLCSWSFAVTGNIVNLGLIGGAVRFWWRGDRASSRGLFFGSLLHLPLLLGLLLYHRDRQECIEETDEDARTDCK